MMYTSSLIICMNESFAKKPLFANYNYANKN